MNHFQLLSDHLPAGKRAEFRKLVDVAENTAGCDIDDGFLGFIEDYVDIAAILERHTIRFPAGFSSAQDLDWTVYDVGCASGFQHILFPFAAKYVGIDSDITGGLPIPLLPNAEFVGGRFAEIADGLKIDRKRSFGIANMSLAYTGQPDDLEAFDRVFLHKYII